MAVGNDVLCRGICGEDQRDVVGLFFTGESLFEPMRANATLKMLLDPTGCSNVPGMGTARHKLSAWLHRLVLRQPPQVDWEA